MLTIYTGRNRLLAPALVQLIAQDDHDSALVIVPRQLTLQTERMLLTALNLRGSFRLQILSPERLCGRIFDAVGYPQGARIDDRGRVMMVRQAVRAAKDDLTLYRNAEARKGFPERAAKQLERFRQAGISPETLRACASEQTGASAMKLTDLSYILEKYEFLIDGKYRDGDDELTRAALQVKDADFLKSCSVWFFGFDIVPPTLDDLAAALGWKCDRVSFLLPLENDPEARDALVFGPIENALHRLRDAAGRYGAPFRRIMVSEEDSGGNLTVKGARRRDDLKLLEEELFAYPAMSANRPARSVQLSIMRNPSEECMFAAALTRRLIGRNCWRWDDVMILCPDVAGYASPLKQAFSAYHIPLFLSASRSAARHRVSECLLTAIRAVEKNYPKEDMCALLATGMLPVTQDEADRLANFAERYALRGSMFLNPLRRGTDDEKAALEPIREKAFAPIVHLRDRLRRAKSMQDQLGALYDYLTEIDAYRKNLAHMDELVRLGLRETAGEEGQVWNRIMGAMDQMYDLMGEKKLSLSELRGTLEDSLSASVIKALPQSGDAVYAQDSNSALTRQGKAILLVGMSDRPAQDDGGLLTNAQRKQLSQQANAYLGPSDDDLSLASQFYLKSALGMAEDYVSISCALTGSDGSSQHPSRIFEMVEGIFPGTVTRGGVTSDEGIDRMLRASPDSAIIYAAKALAGCAEGTPIAPCDRAAIASLSRIARNDPAVRVPFARIQSALNRAQAADSLSPRAAEQLYGTMKRLSISRLETFAKCPFSYYVHYGLRPEQTEPYEFEPSDEGTFCHDALSEFLLRSMDDLNHLSADEAARRMDAVSEKLLADLENTGPLGDSALSRAEERHLAEVARNCAVTLANHMRGSEFHPIAGEQTFGYDGRSDIMLCGDAVMQGRIDRVDAWENCFRIIDYKRGGRKLSLSDIYHGLSLRGQG